jgi:hypothetical protein
MPLIQRSVFRLSSEVAKRYCWVLVAVAVNCSWCVSARATPSEDALRHGRVGLENYTAGRWQSALDEFALADSLMHSPVFRLYVARCKQKLGQWIEARNQYADLIAMPIASDAPLTWQHAADDARKELEELKAVLPSIQLVVSGQSVAMAKWVLTIDGGPIETHRLNGRIELSPGEHVAVLEIENGLPLVKHFSLEAGDHSQTIELQVPTFLETGRTPPLVSQASKTIAVPKPTRVQFSIRPLHHPYRTSGLVALSAGALSAATGIVAGVWAWSERDRLLEQCGGFQCQPAEKARWNRANRLADIATVSIIVGGLSLGAGGYLFFLTVPTAPTRNNTGVSDRSLALGIAGRF